MTCYISNCGHDERGAYTGGVAGDQSTTEWHIIPWYQFGQNVVLRHSKSAISESIAALAEAAAANDNIGYDQSQRLTFWNQLKANNYNVAAIGIPCEADCSSGVCAIVLATGYLQNNDLIKNYVQPSGYTGNMRTMFSKAGFEILTDSKYLNSSTYLQRGDILLNESRHTCIVTKSPYSKPAGLAVDGYAGSKTITRLQQSLNAPYVDGLISGQWIGNRQYLPNLIAVDYTDTSSVTIMKLQKMLGADIDGYVGKDTVSALQKHLNTLGHNLVIDGVLGSESVKALQIELNKGNI